MPRDGRHAEDTDIISSDWHLSDNPRDSYRWRFLEHTLLQLVEKHGTGHRRLFVLGDLTEANDNHSAALVNRLVAGLVKLLEQTHINIVMLRGNHDAVGEAVPFFAFLHHISGIRYIDQPTRTPDWDLFLPHTHNYQRDWADLDTRGTKYIFTHNTFAGAMGDNVHRLTGIPRTALPSHIPVISGDVHRPQIGTNNIRYVGAPYSIDFGDTWQPRVLIRRGSRISTVKLDGPAKRVVTADSTGIMYQNVNKGDILRIVVELHEGDDAAGWPEIRERTRAAAVEDGYVVDSVQPAFKASLVERLRASAGGSAKTDEQLLAEYCDRMQIEGKVRKRGEELL